MVQITATEFKAKLGKYLSLAHRQDVHITKNGTDIAVLTAPKSKSGWVDDISGIIPNISDDEVKKSEAERLVIKHGKP
jgi:prevent-host-death family protein